MFGFGRRRRCRGRCAMTGSAVLADIPDGSTARITAVSGGRSCREKMAAMGLFPGTDVQVIHKPGEDGMMLVSVGSVRLMLDMTMASIILVERAG